MSLAKSSTQVFITRIFKLMVAFATGILVARWLQPDGRGAYSLVTQFHLIVVAIGGMSINQAIIHHSGSGKFTTEEQVSNGILSAAVFTFLTWAVVLTFKDVLNRFLPFHGMIVFLLMVLIPVSMLDANLKGVLQSKYKFKWLNALELMQTLILGSGIVICYCFFQPKLEKVLVVWAISLSLSFLVLFKLLLKVSTVSFKIDWAIFRTHLSFGWKAHLSTVIGLVSLRIDTFILGYLTDRAAVGKYSVAVTLAELIWFLPASISFVLLPRTAHNSEEESAKGINKACFLVFFISLGFSALLALIADPLILYGYGKSYKESVMALWILLPGMVFMSVTTIITPFFLGRLGKPHLGAIVAAVSLVSDTILNLILIPKWGLNGAAVSSTVAYFLSSITNLYLFRRAQRRYAVSII